MNRNLLSVLVVLFITIGVGGYVYVNKLNKHNLPLVSTDFIPIDFSDVAIEFQNPVQNFEELFNANLIWKELNNAKLLQEIESFWNQSDSNFIQLKPDIISLTVFNNSSSDEYYFLLKTKHVIDSELGLTLWKEKSSEHYILFSKSDDFSIFPVFSSTKSIRTTSDFPILESTQGEQQDKVLLYKKEKNKWGVFDVTFSPDRLFVNGYSISEESRGEKIKAVLDVSMLSMLPASFSSLELLHFDSVNQLPIDSSYLVQKSEECACEAGYLGYSWMESPLAFYQESDIEASYLFTKINSVNSYKEAITNLTQDSLVVEVDEERIIRVINEGFNYNSLFKSKTEFNVIVRINDYAILSNSIENLERLLFKLDANLTIEKNIKLADFLVENMSTESEYVHISKGMNIFNFSITEGISITQSNSHQKNLTYHSFLYSKGIKIDGSRANPKWVLGVDTTLIKKIYVVNNHRTNDKDYLIQDRENVVYFITPNGEIKWKKNVGNPIIGEVKNIDILGNDKYQMIFNTKNRLFLIDILGRDLDNFPVKILDSATANVSVMDYDQNQNFRFLVPTVKGIKSVNKNGDLVQGWKQPSPVNKIVGDVEHLLINNKDYITARDELNKLYFYNRKGEVRHSVSATFGYPILWTKGSTIEKSRAVFMDTSSNSIKRQFFSNANPIKLIQSDQKIRDFSYLDYDEDGSPDFVLIFDNEILVYNQDMVLIKKIELPKNVEKVKVFKGGYAFVNQFGDLSLTRKEDIKIINGVDEYRIDFYKSTLRILIIRNKEFKLLHL